jgi:hypothetical protein
MRNRNNICQTCLSLLMLFFLPAFLGCALPKTATKEQMKHEYVSEYTGISKDQIFDKSLRWIAQNFRSAKDVIDYQDKASGSIIAKGIIPNVDYGAMINGDLHFTLTIDCRDGKARYIYTNIDMQAELSGVHHIGDTQGVHEAATREFQKLNTSIDQAIVSKDGF